MRKKRFTVHCSENLKLKIGTRSPILLNNPIWTWSWVVPFKKRPQQVIGGHTSPIDHLVWTLCVFTIVLQTSCQQSTAACLIVMCSRSSYGPLFLPLHFSSSMFLQPPECSSFSPPATVILLILLCFEGLLFLIFTSVMFGTQVHSICTDETVSYPLIDQQPFSFPPIS